MVTAALTFAITDKYSDKNGRTSTQFKLNVRPHVVLKSTIDLDPVLQGRLGLEYAHTDGGDMVACVRVNLTGRCARVNHSTQEWTGADVPVADSSSRCISRQQNHTVRLRGCFVLLVFRSVHVRLA